jgi:hypothetical protein
MIMIGPNTVIGFIEDISYVMGGEGFGLFKSFSKHIRGRIPLCTVTPLRFNILCDESAITVAGAGILK